MIELNLEYSFKYQEMIVEESTKKPQPEREEALIFTAKNY